MLYRMSKRRNDVETDKLMVLVVLMAALLIGILSVGLIGASPPERIVVGLVWQRNEPIPFGLEGEIEVPFYRWALEYAAKHYRITYNLRLLDEDDVIGGALQRGDYDLIVLGGGIGSMKANIKNPAYGENIKRFIAAGGGYYGDCGDSMFAAKGFKGLSPANEKIFKDFLGTQDLSNATIGIGDYYADLEHFNRAGNFSEKLSGLAWSFISSGFTIPVNFLPNHPKIQKTYFNKTLPIVYSGGSPQIPSTNPTMSDIEVLARFTGDGNFPKGSLAGKSAIASFNYKKGRVIVTAPDIYLTTLSKKCKDLVARHIIWVAGLDPEELER